MAYSAIDAFATLCEDLDTGPQDHEDESAANIRVVETFNRQRDAARAMQDALYAILFQVAQGKVLERDACITQAREAYAASKAAGIVGQHLAAQADPFTTAQALNGVAP